MFKDMRRKDKQMDLNQSIEILKNGKYGVLSTVGENGYSYGVPLNYVYLNDSIYFHCAKTGHKLENITHNPKVSFLVVGELEIIPDEFNTKYKSVIVFGKAEEVEEKEKEMALMAMIEKYSYNYLEKGKKYIEKDFKNAKVIRVSIEHITGKEGK